MKETPIKVEAPDWWIKRAAKTIQEEIDKILIENLLKESQK